jgi:hypothetical protein
MKGQKFQHFQTIEQNKTNGSKNSFLQRHKWQGFFFFVFSKEPLAVKYL